MPGGFRCVLPGDGRPWMAPSNPPEKKEQRLDIREIPRRCEWANRSQQRLISIPQSFCCPAHWRCEILCLGGQVSLQVDRSCGRRLVLLRGDTRWSSDRRVFHGCGYLLARAQDEQ